MQYSYFRRYNYFSVGGYLTSISKKTAKSLIKRFGGKIKKEFRLSCDSRIIELDNRNRILISHINK